MKRRTHRVPFYKRTDWWVQIITCLGVIGGLAWSAFHYSQVERPEVARVKREMARIDQEIAQGEAKAAETEANTAALRSQVEAVEDQSRLSEATIADLEDPVRQETARVQLRTALLEHAEAADRLLEAVTPNLSITLGNVALHDEKYIFNFEVKNTGKRAVRVSNVKANVTLTPGYDAKIPERERWSVDANNCSINQLSAGDTSACSIILETVENFDGVARISYSIELKASTSERTSGESLRQLRSSFERLVVDKGLEQNFVLKGQLYTDVETTAPTKYVPSPVVPLTDG